MSFRQLFDRYAAIEDSRERMQLALSHPVLLYSKHQRAMLGEVQREQAEGQPAAGTRHERLVELDALRVWLAQDAQRYPVGIGPVERLTERVFSGEISPGQAKKELLQPDNAEHLTSLYAHLLVYHAEQQATQGEWMQALLWTRLLAEACEAIWPAGEVPEALEVAGIGWIQITGVALGTQPEGGLLQVAHDFGQRQLARLQAPADAGRRAKLLHALGSLYSDPVSSSTGGGVSAGENQLWEQAGLAQHGQLAAAHAGEHPLPSRQAMLQQAQQYFEQALPCRNGPERGKTLKALAQTLLFLARAGKVPEDTQRIEALCREALGLLPAGSYAHNATLGVLQNIGRSAPAAAATVQDHAPGAPEGDTPDRLLLRAGQLQQADPSSALALLAGADALFEQQATETQRRTRWSNMALLIPRALGAVDLARFPGSMGQVAQALAQAAQAEGWSEDQTAATAMALALRAAGEDAEETGLGLLQAATQLSASLAGYHAPVALLLSQLLTGAAVNALNAGQPVLALRRYAEALGPYLRLPQPGLAMNLLRRIADVAGQADPEMAQQVLLSLAPLAFEIERSLHEPGVQQLQEALQRAVGGMGVGDTPVNANLLGMLVQLAKGARFDATLRGGTAFDWRQDAICRDLLERIAALQAEAGGAHEAGEMDEWLLVSAVSDEQLDSGPDAATRAHNLRMAFDRHVRLQSIAGVRSPSIINPELIPHLLDERTVLLDYYFSRQGESNRSLDIVLTTRAGGLVFRNPLRDAKELLVKLGDTQVLVDSLAMRTYLLRQELARDPCDQAMTDEARRQLDEHFELLLGTPTWRHLQTLRAQGMDHLCIRPCGALRYFPLGLLGRDGRDLATDWTVTLLPSLQTLLQPRGAPRSSGGQALGLGYADERYAPLPELPQAHDEVTSVAAQMHSPPQLDDAVDQAAVMAALRGARRVHLCAHGAQVPHAPLFHHLVIATGADAAAASGDDRLCAYELLGEDLLGLEVLTLGSCDSALGRFDAGDNPSGLPAALLSAGVQTLVASLWALADEPARLFFTRFHGALAAGTPRLDAFRSAQLAVRAAWPQARDWAALCYLGDWDRPPQQLPPDLQTHLELH